METLSTKPTQADDLIDINALHMRPSFVLLATSAIIFIAKAFVMFVLNSILRLPHPWEMWVDALMLSMIVIPCLILLIVRPLRQLAARYRAAIAEVQVLRGIIPICSVCKKIRDNEGAWQQIEAYIRSHSAASFSHGLCPDCIRKSYPDEADEIIEEMDARDG